MTSSIIRRTPTWRHTILLAAALALPLPGPAQAQDADTRPLSPAQIALFETPHLQGVTPPADLRYRATRHGPDAFDDTITLHVRTANPDGSKNLAVDYLTGPHHVPFPLLDFRGNPLPMLALENDVHTMHDALGASASFFRNRIREAFVDAAIVTPTTIIFQGNELPARTVTVQPFAHVQRLDRIHSLQQKTYTIVLADAVPGMVADIRIDTPADPALAAPALSDRITLDGIQP